MIKKKLLAVCWFLCLSLSSLIVSASGHFDLSILKEKKVRLSGEVAETLGVRNPYEAKNFIESEHFVYWYDDEFLGQESLLNQELERLEYSWQQLVIVRGYPAPLDQYKLNVYMEEAGGTGIPYLGYTGQAKIDDQGYPFIMMNREILGYSLSSSQLHSTHEFFHTIQYSYASNYGLYRDNATWFMEASAGWVVIDVWGEEEVQSNFIWTLAQTPHLSVNIDARKETSDGVVSPANLHHYSMMVFLHFASQQTSFSFVQQTMEDMARQIEQGGYLDALATLDAVAEEVYGVQLSKVFAEFAARNIYWDYSVMELLVETQLEVGVAQNSRVLATHDQASDGWHYPKSTDLPGLPRSWGAAYLHFSNSELSEVEFSFQSEISAAAQAETEWIITLVKPGQPVQYQTIEVVDGKLAAHVIDIGDAGEFWLSLTPTGPTDDTYLNYDFAYQIAKVGESSPYQAEPTPEPEPEPVAKKSGGGSVGYQVIFVALMSFFIRRKSPMITMATGNSQ